jgi:hypothetical protein
MLPKLMPMACERAEATHRPLAEECRLISRVFDGGSLTVLAQFAVQRGAADAELGGDLLGERAVLDPLGGPLRGWSR